MLSALKPSNKLGSLDEIGDDLDRQLLKVVLTVTERQYIRDVLHGVDATTVFQRISEGLWPLSFAKHVAKQCGVDKATLDGAYDATSGGVAAEKKTLRIAQ